MPIVQKFFLFKTYFNMLFLAHLSVIVSTLRGLYL